MARLALGLLIMTLLSGCNSGAFVKGMADGYNQRVNPAGYQKQQMDEMKRRQEQMEAQLRSQCMWQGGIYNPYTGCQIVR